MNLRTQMLLAGALTLAVPVIGWQSVKQLDASLRQTRADEQSLKVANARLALAETKELQLLLAVSQRPSQVNDLYAEEARYPLFVDGYEDDWQHLNAAPKALKYADNKADSVSQTSTVGAKLKMRFARRGVRLFMFIDVRDRTVVYHRPPRLRIDLGEGETNDAQSVLANGDAIEMLYTVAAEPQHIVFRAIAPGAIKARVASTSTGKRKPGAVINSIQAYWAATPNGFQLEASLPLPAAASEFAVAMVDVDENNGNRALWIGTRDPATMQLPGVIPNTGGARTQASRNTLGRIHYASDNTVTRLQPWVTRGTRARLFDRQGRLISDVNQLYDRTDLENEYDPATRGFLNAVLFRLFAYFVSDTTVIEKPFNFEEDLHLADTAINAVLKDDALTRHYISPERDRVLGTLVAIGGDKPNGFLLFESNEDLASAYSASRVARLFSLLTLVSLLAGLVLLIYASILSMRIRKLSRLANRAVSAEGRVQGLPQSEAQDEIGELSRNLSALLARTSGYTQYLEALSSRLSHELRTPLSVVRTSIENMDRDKLDHETVTLLDRASGGADQLNSIIRALVESTRLEQTVQQAQMQHIDINAWLDGSVQRYRQIYPQINFELLRAGAFRSGAKASSGFDTVTPKVLGSPELLQQAFDKLVDNAVSFSTEQTIELGILSTKKSAARIVRLAVKNTGPAIADEQISRMFEPMFSHRSSDDGQLHMGLGLYIVRMIAEAHGGRSWALNTSQGVIIGMDIPEPG